MSQPQRLDDLVMMVQNGTANKVQAEVSVSGVLFDATVYHVHNDVHTVRIDLKPAKK